MTPASGCSCCSFSVTKSSSSSLFEVILRSLSQALWAASLSSSNHSSLATSAYSLNLSHLGHAPSRNQTCTLRPLSDLICLCTGPQGIVVWCLAVCNHTLWSAWRLALFECSIAWAASTHILAVADASRVASYSQDVSLSVPAWLFSGGIQISCMAGM